jgi:hypothetical protein
VAYRCICEKERFKFFIHWQEGVTEEDWESGLSDRVLT